MYPNQQPAQSNYPQGMPMTGPQGHLSTPPTINITNTQNQPERKKVRHLMHLVLTLLTGGLWGIVWIIACIRAS